MWGNQSHRVRGNGPVNLSPGRPAARPPGRGGGAAGRRGQAEGRRVRVIQRPFLVWIVAPVAIPTFAGPGPTPPAAAAAAAAVWKSRRRGGASRSGGIRI